jgi:hypothetical protein
MCRFNLCFRLVQQAPDKGICTFEPVRKAKEARGRAEQVEVQLKAASCTAKARMIHPLRGRIDVVIPGPARDDGLPAFRGI